MWFLVGRRGASGTGHRWVRREFPGRGGFHSGFVQPPLYSVASLRAGSVGRGLGWAVVCWPQRGPSRSADGRPLMELTVLVAWLAGRVTGILVGPLSPVPWGFLTCLTWHDGEIDPRPLLHRL